MSVLRRIRAYAGQFGLLAALALVAAVLAAGAPRIANGLADTGLRSDLGRLPFSSRDLTFAAPAAPYSGGGAGPGALAAFRRDLPAPLPSVIAEGWFSAEAGPAGLGSGSCPPLAAVRWQPSTAGATRLVDGRRPATPASGTAAEAIVGQDAARALGVRPGQTVRLTTRFGSVAPIRIVGVFVPTDRAAPIWDDMRLAPTACPSLEDGTRMRATLLTDQAGIVLTSADGVPSVERWRYRLAAAALTADAVPALTTAVVAARRGPPPGTTLQSSLDAALSTSDGRLRAVRALLAVVQAGVLATLAGLILLAARLAADRRREEYALLRARGGTATAVAGRALAETAVAVPVAVVVGWLAGAALPGRADPAEPLLIVLLGLLAVFAPAVWAARNPRFGVRRRDLVRSRPSIRRLTAEGSLVALTVLGLFLLRRRGLAAGVDPYLICVPVLFALAVSVLALRLVPWPLGWAGRFAARARGAVTFLGLTGAGRSAPLSAGPLAVLVVAVATGVFTSVVTSTVGHARDLAADQQIPADVRVTGFFFAPDTAARIAALPGVTRTVPVLLDSGASIGGSGQAQVMVLNAATAGLGLPAALTGARPGPGALPAVASPEVAHDFPGGGTVDVQGRPYRFRIAAVRDAVPGVAVGARSFLILPQQAMAIPAFQPLLPNQILVSGHGYDPERIRAVADAGQRDQLERLTGRRIEPWQLPRPAEVTTRHQYRASLDDTGVNGVLTFTFTAGVLAAAALALLAVGFAVLAGAPARGRTLSRLRTMGLSARQGRRLLVVELVPLLGVALFAGLLAGAALPALAGPALGLAGFTAGVPARTHLDPLLAGGVLIVAILAVAAALAVENLVNRRARLGEVLRLGEEN